MKQRARAPALDEDTEYRVPGVAQGAPGAGGHPPHPAPRHATGQWRQRTFSEEANYALHLYLLAAAAERARTEVWAYCLLSYAALRKAESIGRPIGSSEWLSNMEARIGRALAPKKRGPAPKRGLSKVS
jgi:hypothetical protein